MKPLREKRDPGPDMIRCLALFFVSSVHFLTYTGYYDQPMAGKRMLVLTILRAFFITCVPLFLMLSGYLMSEKTLSKQYYKRLGKILFPYVVICAVYAVVCNTFLNTTYSWKDLLFNTLGFSETHYVWYVEMYLGLFLLIPFLNTLYQNLPSRGWKLALVGSLLAMTALPGVLNVYGLRGLSLWPAQGESGTKLVPAWWKEFYPITYYFIGCYLKEYGLKLPKWLNLLLIPVAALVLGLFCWWRACGGSFVWGDWCAYPSLLVVSLSVLIFAFFIGWKHDRFPTLLSKLLAKLSGICFGAYLASGIYDTILYPMLNERVTDVSLRFGYYLLMVPTVVVLSLLTSFLVDLLQRLLRRLWSGVAKKREKQIPTANCQ